jgi:hypothetical protein
MLIQITVSPALSVIQSMILRCMYLHARKVSYTMSDDTLCEHDVDDGVLSWGYLKL